MQKTKEEIIEYINGLDGYEGYVQFSDRPIDKDKDIFCDGKKFMWMMRAVLSMRHTFVVAHTPLPSNSSTMSGT